MIGGSRGLVGQRVAELGRGVSERVDSVELGRDGDVILRVVSYLSMRTARAKVVKGKIVTRARFPEGTTLLLVVDEPQPAIELDDEDQAALDAAIAATREGKLIPLETVRALLRNL